MMPNNSRILKNIERSFNVSLSEMERIVRNFHLEMERGLAGKRSSLKMIPAYVDRPTGKEKGKFIALDLGGTNFRILEIELKGSGKITRPRIMKFALDKKTITGPGEKLFDFIAGCLKNFLKEQRIGFKENISLGFTFSFPVKQTAVASGSLICWTKGFNANGVVGKDVVRLLKEAFHRKGINNIDISALANDTVGTLVAKSYEDPYCDVGIIIGTGTNACYPERIPNITKKNFPGFQFPRMIINIEWGNFDKLKPTGYDRNLDRASENAGEQMLEKMVSGMYLGEVAKLVFEGLIKKKAQSFKTEYMSVIESDISPGLKSTNTILEKTGLYGSTVRDRQIIKTVCSFVSRRAARISAACIAAIVTKMDPYLLNRHVIAIDGSLYEKHPIFSNIMKVALSEIFGNKSSHIKMALSKDGSGKGAAIIAAVAVSKM